MITIIESYQAAVPYRLYEKALDGDKEARKEIAEMLDCVVCYEHAISLDTLEDGFGWTLVPIQTLLELGIIKSVTLFKDE